MRFSILETNLEVVTRHRPVVMITSNNEKELPDAFLRRCIFYYIEFPDVSLMRKIIACTTRTSTPSCSKRVGAIRRAGRNSGRTPISSFLDPLSALLSAGLTSRE